MPIMIDNRDMHQLINYLCWSIFNQICKYGHTRIYVLYMCIWHTTMPSSKQICCLHLPNSFLFFLFRELNNRSLSFLTFSALRNDGPRDGAGGAGADVVGSRSSIARDRHRNLTRSPIVVTPNLLRSASDSDCMS